MSSDLQPADIPVVILAGGFGTRLREETERVPKPMVQIGDKPILWHIMKHYTTHGFRRFIICLGYKGWVIKEYFLNYVESNADLRIDLRRGSARAMGDITPEDWEVTLAETGLHSGSTGRLLGAARYIDTPSFMYTYGDGVGPVDLAAVRAQHDAGQRLVTVTGVRPSSRYGLLAHDQERVTGFDEKPEVAEGYVNGGFFCIDAEVLPLLEGRDPLGFFELDLMPELVAQGQVDMHRHHGFWHSMDTYRDFTALAEVKVLAQQRHGDDRGWFARAWCERELAEAGLDARLSQLNLSRTTTRGTVRGLHRQLAPHAESKLVYVVQGAIYDVAVDARPGSPTRWQHVGRELSADNGLGLVIPMGFLHGFQALTDDVVMLYAISERYAPDAERGVHHADPTIGIVWPLPVARTSTKDAALPTVAELAEQDTSP